jgi:hypothetical protein
MAWITSGRESSRLVAIWPRELHLCFHSESFYIVNRVSTKAKNANNVCDVGDPRKSDTSNNFVDLQLLPARL